MRRGEIRWCQLKAPDKRRPVLVLTRDSAIKHLHNVTIAPVTSTIRGIKSELTISREDGMPGDCAINFYNIQTVPKHTIESLITTLSPARMQEAEQSLRYALDITDSAN